ncbi:MAG: hypothetical protein GY820_03620 [Gammaproteobacteria bacterium]|nr:hypothetical protein [Gammaproteobacteria bacterium]
MARCSNGGKFKRPLAALDRGNASRYRRLIRWPTLWNEWGGSLRHDDTARDEDEEALHTSE